MARVTIQLPSVLAAIVEGRRQIEVEGDTVRQVLDALVATTPTLAVHLFDESGAFRPHVLCFHNETNTRWLEDLESETVDGDTITIIQAVSGG